MVKIALVDDDAASTTELQAKLTRFASENDETFSIAVFHDGVAFLDHYQPVDIVFMDVEMPYLNGIAAAKKLREIDTSVALIYVTNFMQYAVEGYEVNALGYLLKPINYARLSSVLQKTLNSFVTQAKGLLVKTASGLKKIYPDELLFVAISGHLLEYHTSHAVFESWGSLKEIEKNLPEKHFARPNSNTLVNLSFVKGFDRNDVLLSEGSRLAMSGRKKKEFEAAFKAFNTPT